MSINEILSGPNNLVRHKDFPLSNKYADNWVLENHMGPNVLWLTEWLCSQIEIKPGMRVLDLGCGKALSSIFMAKEYGVEVWATDLWIVASENYERIEQAGLCDKVFPIHAEAHSLPYAKSFFDIIVSVDSYHYFGTDQIYLGYLQKFLKPGGQIAIVLPGLHKEFDDGVVPEHLTKQQSTGESFWQWDCCTFHGEEWWNRMWRAYPFLSEFSMKIMDNGGHIWLDWERILDKWDGEKLFPSDIESLVEDDNKNITFISLLGKIVEDRDSMVIGETIGELLVNN